MGTIAKWAIFLRVGILRVVTFLTMAIGPTTKDKRPRITIAVLRSIIGIIITRAIQVNEIVQVVNRLTDIRPVEMGALSNNNGP